MKQSPTLYKGIEFVNLHQLPVDQQTLLQNNREVERIKIQMDGKIVGDCIQYATYCDWYARVFETSIASVSLKKQVEEALLPKTIALGKI